MSNETKQTAMELLFLEFKSLSKVSRDAGDEQTANLIDFLCEREQQAKEMEKEQIGYSKEDVLTAGEMGEINTHDTKHIVSYLDEAKQFNIRR
jgi:hypothetical protein